MAISTAQIPTTTSGKDAVYNPNSQLTNEQFMQLFLTELQYQDPTDPMDTDKMLEQTAYLSTMEMNQNMQKTLNSLSNTLQSQTQLNTISAIGKMADTGKRTINITEEDTNANFELYFNDDISEGNVIIKDKLGNIVKEFPLEAHTKGVLSFNWDLRDNNGNRVTNDTYEITAEYIDPNGNSHSTALGAYPIESVRFENGTAYAKIGSKYIPFSEIKEIYQWQ